MGKNLTRVPKSFPISIVFTYERKEKYIKWLLVRIYLTKLEPLQSARCFVGKT